MIVKASKDALQCVITVNQARHFVRKKVEPNIESAFGLLRNMMEHKIEQRLPLGRRVVIERYSGVRERSPSMLVIGIQQAMCPGREKHRRIMSEASEQAVADFLMGKDRNFIKDVAPMSVYAPSVFDDHIKPEIIKVMRSHGAGHWAGRCLDA